MMETSNPISRRYELQAQAIAIRLPKVLQQRGLAAPFSEFLLTSAEGVVLLFAVLDVHKIQRLEAYLAPELLHHLSTDLQGRPVFLSNSSGLRYAIPLSPLPHLPRLINFPGLESGQVLLGVSHAGEIVHLPWPKLGHLLVAGKTGSGKSIFLRLLVYQAIAEGAQLLLVDLDGATFPMLADHPALVSPMATSPQTAQEAVERALGDCEHRAELYQQMAGFPENLEEYNTIAVRQGKEPLSRLLVVLDEFSTLMTALGGPKSAFASQVAELGWRGRKFGVHLVFAAQDFTKQVVGRVRDQVNAVVCFRVRSMEAARAVGCPDAVHISESRPGLACTDRWGPVQTFYLEKHFLSKINSQSLLSDYDVRLAQRALTEAEGKMSIPLLVSWGISERRARALVEAWELRGWLQQDPARQNARYITPKFQDLLSSRQTHQAGSNQSS
ncbi:MAG: FtsK/SpoIIIE domain-containing protein [Chloroflexi bacterium]|nr:FtsK/SpoIIIE domain-containing protein [Chloroflexota bacterium]